MSFHGAQVGCQATAGTDMITQVRRQQFRLIKAAMPAPAPMQRNRNQQVYVRSAANSFQPQMSQNPGQMTFPLVLPALDQASQIFAVQPGRDDLIVGGWM